MPDGGLFGHIQEGFSPVQSQREAVDLINIIFIRKSNGIFMKNEALITETSTLFDNEKKYEFKTNVDNHFFIMLLVVVVAVFTLAALITCF